MTLRMIELKSRARAQERRDEIACALWRQKKGGKREKIGEKMYFVLAAAACLHRNRPGWPEGAFIVSEIFSECIDSRLGIRNGVLRNLIIRHRQLSREPFFAGTGCVVVFRLSIGK